MAGPSLIETFKTPDTLADNGIKYVCDWANDDQPYAMRVKSGQLISVPYAGQINDLPIFTRYGMPPDDFYQLCKAHFDTLYEEGKETVRVMCIGLHPYIIATPYRIRCLDRALKYITGHDRVWVTTGPEIFDLSRYLPESLNPWYRSSD